MDDDFHSLKTKRDANGPISVGGDSYPKLRLSGAQAAECGADECEHGEEYEMTIRVRCKSIGESYGNEKKPSVTFDIIACTDCDECDDESDEEDEEDEKEPEAEDKPKGGKEKPGHISGRAIIIA